MLGPVVEGDSPTLRHTPSPKSLHVGKGVIKVTLPRDVSSQVGTNGGPRGSVVSRKRVSRVVSLSDDEVPFHKSLPKDLLRTVLVPGLQLSRCPYTHGSSVSSDFPGRGFFPRPEPRFP